MEEIIESAKMLVSCIWDASLYVHNLCGLDLSLQRSTKVKPFICTMPLRLDDGWNQIQFNLADFVKRAYGKMVVEKISMNDVGPFIWSASSFPKLAGTTCVEALRVQVHANCRIRRIYFADRVYSGTCINSHAVDNLHSFQPCNSQYSFPWQMRSCPQNSSSLRHCSRLSLPSNRYLTDAQSMMGGT